MDNIRHILLLDERLREFYTTFQIMFGDMLMACRVIHSGMVEKNNYRFLDSTHRSVLTLGNGIPGVALLSALVFGGLKTVPENKQQEGINLAAGMFATQVTTIPKKYSLSGFSELLLGIIWISRFENVSRLCFL